MFPNSDVHYLNVPNNLFFHCELSHGVGVWRKIHFRIYINVFYKKLSWATESDIIYEEFTGFMRDSKTVFLLNILERVINKLVSLPFAG